MKKLIILFITIFSLASCSAAELPEYQEIQPETEYIQESRQPFTENENQYIPLNYDNQNGIWFPYLNYEECMQGKTEETFRNIIHGKFSDIANQRLNTVYVHAHPCGDAYYNSQIFPKGIFLDGDFDPLEIMTEEAHSMGLSVHAWINPLRCQTVEEMENLPDNFIIKQWADTPDCHFAEIVNNRWYLNPAYDEVTELICSCADEILNNYNVDGIHIDDYFYPTTDPIFDRIAFEESRNSNLSEWRTENCSRFVKALYDTVKSHGNRFLFGISPQGNINANYDSQYADVKEWAGNSGWCDYIAPQIYFGFENQTCPFDETLKNWEELVSGSGVSLVAGLAEYKLGKTDKWAGAAGENEWIDNPDIIERQIELVKSSSASGYALYK